MNARDIRFLIVAWLSALTSVPVGVALGVPFNYVEIVDGDLPIGGSPLPILAFDVGVNTVSGRFGSDGIDPDFDSFAFTVPAGSQLSAGRVVLVDVNGNVISSEWQLRVGSADYLGGTTLEFVGPNSPGQDSLTSVPLGPDVYNISHVSFLWAEPAARADYTFTFELAPLVPEPASLMLVGMALGSILVVRRLWPRNR